MLRIVTLFLLLSLSPLSHAAQVDYRATIDALNHRLDQTLNYYKKQDVAQAKETVQNAYFELFEGIEGTIYINFSHEKSYALESAFGKIRRMMAQGASIQEVADRIALLQDELNQLPTALEEGYQLIADDGSLDHSVAPEWANAYQYIDDALTQALILYQEADYAGAKAAILDAQFEGYKNSHLEIALRNQVSSHQSALIDQAFSAMVRLAKVPQNLHALAYEMELMRQNLAELLVGLKPTESAQEEAPQAETTDVAGQEVEAQILAEMKYALNLYQDGQVREAMGHVQDTYFDVFEASGFESRIGAHDAAMKTNIEGYFTRVVSLMKAQVSVDKIAAQIDDLGLALAEAVSLVAPATQSLWMLILASFTIIFREGLEAILIVTAITAFLVKNNHHGQLSLVRHSVLTALGASVLTAVMFHFFFKNSGASRELLEGVTMLLASVLMFMMSYWLFAKVEADRWKKYIENTVSNSLSAGSSMGLWMACFLAVYREGAETLLFYAALAQGTEQSGYLALGLGFVAGLLVLCAVYGMMRFTMLRIPLKTFFKVTGGFIYLMAFIFAGQGMVELMEAKVFQPTFIATMPEVSLLGIYPYVETLIPQALLAIAALIAWQKLRPASLPRTSSV